MALEESLRLVRNLTSRMIKDKAMKTIFFNIRHIILLLLFQLLFIPVSHADQVVVTSGRVEYDPFGRVVRVYHPTVDSERVDSFSRAVDNVAPTRTEYDELDRPLVVHLPDETITTYEYSKEPAL